MLTSGSSTMEDTLSTMEGTLSMTAPSGSPKTAGADASPGCRAVDSPGPVSPQNHPQSIHVTCTINGCLYPAVEHVTYGGIRGRCIDHGGVPFAPEPRDASDLILWSADGVQCRLHSDLLNRTSRLIQTPSRANSNVLDVSSFELLPFLRLLYHQDDLVLYAMTPSQIDCMWVLSSRFEAIALRNACSRCIVHSLNQFDLLTLCALWNTARVLNAPEGREIIAALARCLRVGAMDPQRLRHPHWYLHAPPGLYTLHLFRSWTPGIIFKLSLGRTLRLGHLDLNSSRCVSTIRYTSEQERPGPFTIQGVLCYLMRPVAFNRYWTHVMECILDEVILRLDPGGPCALLKCLVLNY